MYAITVRESGGPDVLEWVQHPTPAPGSGEVLVDVVATAVNRADLLQRQGRYLPPPGSSEIIGLECSGRIVALGVDTDGAGWQVGDEVCALLSGGGYAQQVVVPVAQLMPIPPGFTLVEAGGFPEVACTVWSNLVGAARLVPGEVVLINGASGGVGTHAIQVAKALGATVAATAGSKERLQRCRELGAEIVIDYHHDVAAALLAATGGAGADVILDNMGASGLSANLDALATGGRLVIIGLQGGTRAELDIGVLLRKRASVGATNLRGRPTDGPDGKAAIITAVRENLWPLLATGQVRPVVHGTLGLDQAAQAHRLVEAGGLLGKVIMTVPGG